MRTPKHISDLADAGKTLKDLEDFRFRLSAFRITCGWNTSLRTWIFGKVPCTGPTFISLKVGLGALVDYMGNPEELARQFEAAEKNG